MMRVYRAAVPYLDECGHIYLSLVGADHQPLRLNKSASELWRVAIGSDPSGLALSDEVAEFTKWLQDVGALEEVHDEGRSA
jgi:hypothetical protein